MQESRRELRERDTIGGPNEERTTRECARGVPAPQPLCGEPHSRSNCLTTRRLGPQAPGPPRSDIQGCAELTSDPPWVFSGLVCPLSLLVPTPACRMEFPAAPVPSLVKYESPLGVGDDVAAKGKGSSKTVDVHLEEILNSVLPPRSVLL